MTKGDDIDDAQYRFFWPNFFGIMNGDMNEERYLQKVSSKASGVLWKVSKDIKK